MAVLTADQEASVRTQFAPGAGQAAESKPVAAEGKVELPPTLSVKELAEYLDVKTVDIIKELMKNGVMANINQQIDFDTAAIVADSFGVQASPMAMDAAIAEQVVGEGEGTQVKLTTRSELFSNDGEAPENLKPRPPVVTVMGHVDHGKTSLLDAVRQTKVAAGEAGGITQSIGAYVVEEKGRRIVFLDTPGHEAFTAMRARGAQVTDLAVLVVAADDGVMPQTVEAISHAKAAQVPIVVAINKIDKDGANPDRVKQGLSEQGLVPEDWGGQTVMVPVSAKQKTGISEMLEMILLVADLQDLKANPAKLAAGTVIDAHLEKGRGPVATVLVQNGTLRVGDNVVVGHIFGKVRALLDDRGRKMKEAGPATPAVVTGLPDVPTAGDIFQVVSSEKVARTIAGQRAEQYRVATLAQTRRVTLADLSAQVGKGAVKDLNLVLKADSNGSVEALKGSLLKIQDPQVQIKIVFEGVGPVTESDILLAAVSNALVIAFNVKSDALAQKAAEREKVDIRSYDVVYNVTNDIERAIKGLYEPTFVQVWEGRADVLTPIKIPKLGIIAGSRVQDGKITSGSTAKVLRDNKLIHEGQIAGLKRFKDDVREVVAGLECGIRVDGYQDFQEGDVIESYQVKQA
ncbi:MAG: translation initiation factor IF-2 [Chloroflexi bacterium]|nr:MAG: translation initiation factor IF-2 [Chloroflexota bacterium]TMD83184.1 MAG: translation initiation factor IF-2 [Chloroflexota bacterium]